MGSEMCIRDRCWVCLVAGMSKFVDRLISKNPDSIHRTIAVALVPYFGYNILTDTPIIEIAKDTADQYLGRNQGGLVAMNRPAPMGTMQNRLIAI